MDSIPRHQRPSRLANFLFGVPYYPEHWDDAVRVLDGERMAGAGVNVVRMMEFAWDVIEPEAGRYDFGLFDETIERLGRYGIQTILCTPTAAPPRRLTYANPHWLRVNELGVVQQHGSRQHCCTNQAEFQRASQEITQAIAEHYRDNANVIGWQTDNEFYCHFSHCYCPACEAGFQQWLERRYETIERLNAAWGTRFWALTFDSFDQIPLPYPTHPRPAEPNPSHVLDYLRYQSDGIIAFQRQQVEILRRVNERWWITHNGMFGMIDYWKLSEDLDFLGVDIYPQFADSPLWASYKLQECRAVSGSFIVPELQGGPGGQRLYMHEQVQPGRMRLWAWQGVAHGADGILHFRWRSCRFGAEQYWCGILDHDNVPRRRLAEMAREGEEFGRLSDDLAGSVLEVDAAVLIEKDQANAHESSPLGLEGPKEQSMTALGELMRRRLRCGLVDAHDSLAGLKWVIVSGFSLMDKALADKLGAFVHEGGHVLVTAYTAARDRDNQVIGQTRPGLLAELCGVSVEELGYNGSARLSIDGERGSFSAGSHYEILAAHDATILGKWQVPQALGPHAAAKQPALTCRDYGKGRVYYLGTFLTAENAGAVMDYLQAGCALQSLAHGDGMVEVTCRRGPRGRLLFLLNHDRCAHVVGELPTGLDLITGRAVEGTLELAAYDVAVIRY